MDIHSTNADIDVSDTAASSLIRFKQSVVRRYQIFLDTTTPHTGVRWIVFGLLLAGFLLRVFITHGWYIVCYGLGIYLLSLFLLFLQPKFIPTSTSNPDLDNDGEDGDGISEGPSLLPTQSNEEFRPFIRRLPEFKFWVAATRAVLVSIIMTFLDIFDIPVYWPILLGYFIFLVIVTMRRQIRHMVKYRYVPFNIGKKTYAGSSAGSDTRR